MTSADAVDRRLAPRLGAARHHPPCHGFRSSVVRLAIRRMVLQQLLQRLLRRQSQLLQLRLALLSAPLRGRLVLDRRLLVWLR